MKKLNVAGAEATDKWGRALQNIIIYPESCMRTNRIGDVEEEKG